MKTIFPILLSISFYFISANNVSLAQKIESTPIVGAGRVVMYTDFEGLLGNKEIRSNVRAVVTKYNYNLLVYENGKQSKKKDIEIPYNDSKYVPIGYFLKETKIVGYFIAGSKNTEVVKLCLQEFDPELNPIGQPIETVELPKAVDPSKLLNNKSGGMFKDKLVKEQELKMKYDKNSGTVLFSYSLQLVKEQNVSYCKIILLDSDYNVLNNYDYEAASGENYIQAIPQRIFENNDAMVSISEGVKVIEKDGYTQTFNISKQGLIYIPANGTNPKELELIPDQSRITNIAVSENLALNGDVSYGILSSEYDENKMATTAYISLYKYNKESEKIERESYKYETKDVFQDYNVRSIADFPIKKIYNLKDGSILIWLNAIGYGILEYGNIFIKIDPNKKISWIKGFRKESGSSISGLNGSIDFFDDNGNLNLVFNFHPKKIKDNSLDTYLGKGVTFSGSIIKVDLGSIPVAAIININSGDITMKKMNLENPAFGAIVITDCEKLDNEGKYRMHMMINKKLQFVDIDFNAN